MPLATLLWHFSRAMAFASLKNGSNAGEEQRLFNETKKQVFETKIFQRNSTKKMVSVMEYLMAAKIAENDNLTNEAIKFFQQAINEQDSLPYNESPIWFFSVRQYLGAFFLKIGRYKEAEQVFREDLKKIPNNSRSLFGLKESLAAQSNFYGLSWVDRAFQQAFKYSDISLTIDNL